MANEYFQPGSVPAPNAPGSSAVMRQEFASISTGFDKLPILAGHANELVTVNATGTALVTGGTVLGDYVTKDGAFTLTNKTMAWADNIWPGFGTGATKNAGTGAGEVLLLSQSNKLPALDGSLLTGVTTSQISGVTDIAHGGTGATTVGGAQTALGIDLKADANNAVLTGAPTAPTPPTGDNSARVATTYFVTETLASIGSFAPSNAAPLMNGVANAGVGALGSRDDHVHPTDTTRAPVNSPTFTGNPTAPTPAVNDNDTSIATTAFVNAEIAADRPYPNAVPLMDGVAAMGAAANVARQDHVHPTDTTRAPINSPTFTGDPRAPTPLTSDNDTSIATTAFVQSLIAQQPPGVQVSNGNPLMNGAVAPGTGVEASRYDHVHPSDTSRVAKSGDTMTGTLAIDAGSLSLVSMNVSGVPKGYLYSDAGAIGILNNLGNYVLRNPTGTVDVGVIGNLTAANLSGTNTGDQTAALVPFTPVGNIAANNVQAAIQELDSETQAGLATKVSKSGDTMTGGLVVNSANGVRVQGDSGVAFEGGVGKEFSLLWETQPGSAIGTTMARIGLRYNTTPQWAGASVDFIRGNSVNDGRLRFSNGPTHSLMLQDATATFSHTTLACNNANIAGTATCGSIALPGSSGSSTGAPMYLYGLGAIVASINGVHVAGSYLGARINVQSMAGGYYEFKDNGVATAPVSWTGLSDERLKDNIVPIDDALTRLNGFDGCFFTRKDVDPERQRAGFIAQRVQTTLPAAVGSTVRTDNAMEAYSVMEGDSLLNVDPTAILALAVQAIKELSTKLDAAVAEIAALKAQ